MQKLFTFLLLTLLVGVINAQVSKTVNVATSGTLTTLLTATEKTTITSLTLTGNIDARDIKCIRDEIVNLAFLDMSIVKIKPYTGTDGPTPTAYSYTYPENEIPQFSFSKDETIFNSTLKIFYLPNSTATLGLYALRNCSGLTSLVIPASVVLIGDWVFRGCTSMKTITCLSTNPPAAGMSFGGISLTAVYVPIGSVSAYKAVLGWSLFNIVENVLKVSSQSASSITLSTAVLNANLDFIATTPVSSYGFCWNTSGSPTVSDYKVDNGAKSTIGTYNNMISDLSPATTYYVKAYATDGERTVYGNEVSFTTASIPSVAGTISGLQTVCQGQSAVTYTVPTVAYATSYIWSLPSGVTGSSSTNGITVNYSKTFTSGNISVKGHNDFGDGTASTKAITANLLPVNAGIISGKTSVCQGETSITYTVPSIDNATSYSWTLPTGAIGTSTSNSINVNYGTSAVSGDITVKGHNDCGDGIASALPVSVNQLPVISVTDKTIICGGSVSLNSTTNYYGIGTLTYLWSPTTGLNDATIANPTATVTSDITYTVTVTTPNGCTATKNVKVSVTPLTANAGVDKTIICGGTAQLNNVITNYTGNGTLTYLWSPTTGLNDATIANPTATVTNDITYTVTVTTPNECTTSKNVAIKIIPMGKPQIGIVSVNSSNKNIVVWNKPVTIGIDSYSIYRETTVSDVFEKIGTVPYSDLSVFVDNSSAPDVKSNKYKISILDKSGQESPLSDSHKTMHLSINKGQNNTWNLIWEPYTGFTPSTYNIYRGTSATNISFIDATSGSSTQYSDVSAPSGDVYYQLEVISPTLVTPSQVKSTLQKIKDSENIVTVSYNSSRSNVASNVTNGINELNAESNSIHVYPNPVKDQLKIDFIGGSTFEILNLMGQIVYTGNLNNSNIVQTSNFSSGVYLIKFNAGKSLEYKKFIKN